MQKDNIQFKSLLSDIAEEHWQHAHFSGINIQVDAASDLPPIKGSEAMIRRAVSNFITNGIKYAPDSGIMTLKAEQVNGEVIVSVKDNGPGIPQQDLIRVFEKFERIKQRGTENVKGSGLGLAIVKSIVEKHGGRVWCQSQVGKGSTFGMSLPVVRPEKVE
jgi:signal transduction histidine kinase